MKTSTFERAMVQNAYTTPLRHEQLGTSLPSVAMNLERSMNQNDIGWFKGKAKNLHNELHGRQPMGHACTTPHSHQMGSTAHSIGGTAVGLAIIIGAVATGYKSTKPSTTRRTSKIIKVATLATAAFTAGGFAQRY